MFATSFLQTVFSLNFRCNVRIRFIGKFPDSDAMQFGVELEEPNGSSSGCIGDRCVMSNLFPNHGAFITDQELTDLKVMRPSSLLFHRFLEQRHIPQDVLQLMTCYLPCVGGRNHKVMVFHEGDDEYKYQKYDVFDLDGQMRGPVIYKPMDLDDGNKSDKNRGVRIDPLDKDAFEVLDEMAAKYGFIGKRMKRLLEYKYKSLHLFPYALNGIDEDFASCWISRDLNGVRFVMRDS